MVSSHLGFAVGRINRGQQRIDELFPAILRRWLAKLPAKGFNGTSAELWESMDATRKPFEAFPAPNALLRHLDYHAHILTAAWVAVRHLRTARARLVVISRA